jgi:subtilisin family serine protease
MKLSGLVVVAGLAGSVWAQAQVREIPGSMEFSGRLIARPVQIETLGARGLSPERIGDTIRQAEGVLAQYEEFAYEPLVDHHVIGVPAGKTENEVIGELMATGLFEFVEPDWILYPIGCPDDTRFGSQWHHDADKMRSCDAWGIHSGDTTVTVGICDTGIQTTHSDLQLHRKEGYNAVNRLWESEGGQIGPVASHGTQVTGCAAANGDNGNGVSGVGWNLSHRMLRVSNSSGGSAQLSTLTHAALTAIQAGDKVANVSYSGVTSSSVRSTATTIKDLGGLLVWAAGNDRANLNWGDRDNDDVIVVGATTGTDGKANFSAFGRSVDLFAPGNNVHTTTTGGGYASVSGTSFASPLTAGLVGLIWSYNPDLTPDEVEAIVKAGCDDLGTQGEDDTFGHGRINSYESLLLAGGNSALALPFDEPFAQLTLDGEVWIENTGALVTDVAGNEPSAPYSLGLDGSDSITSERFHLSDAPFPSYFSFFTQHSGVEAGKQLVVEYRNDSGVWTEFMIITSDGANQGRFEFHQNHLIFDAYHDNFAIRFRADGENGTDDWYIDDVHVGEEVTPPDDCVADFNADGSVNTQDVLAFLNAWSAGQDSADVNGDGSVNSQDVLLFLNLWNAGC